MGGVETKNRVDNLVIREEGRLRISLRGHTNELRSDKTSKGLKNEIRVMRSHGKHVICIGYLMKGMQRAEKEDIPRYECHDSRIWRFH